jgi:hypothetical protein
MSKRPTKDQIDAYRDLLQDRAETYMAHGNWATHPPSTFKKLAQDAGVRVWQELSALIRGGKHADQDGELDADFVLDRMLSQIQNASYPQILRYVRAYNRVAQ